MRSHWVILASICTVGPLEQCRSSFLFSLVSRHLEYDKSLQYCELGEVDTSPLGSPLNSWNVGCTFFPKRSWEVGISPAHSQGRGSGEWVTTRANRHLCPQRLQPGPLSCQWLDSGKMETSPWGSRVKSLNISYVFQSSLAPSPGVGSVFLIMWCWARGRNSGKWGPQIFYWLWCGWFCACLGV